MSQIPLWLKIGYTALVAVIVPIYWLKYGAANFLWFSDIAFILLVPALWWESGLIASMMALSVLLLENRVESESFGAAAVRAFPDRLERLHVQKPVSALAADAFAVPRRVAAVADLAAVPASLGREPC